MIDRTLYPGVTTDEDRHGNRRHYYRAPGRRKERIHAAYGTPGWPPAYADAKRRSEGTQSPVTRQRPAARKPRLESLDWLLESHYYMSVNWRKDLKETTRIARRYALDRLVNNVGDDGQRFGNLPFAKLTKRHIIKLR